MNRIPAWRLAGDWFDICSCDIPCPCEFAQAPTDNACEGMLAWHIREGQYGEIRLDGFNLLALAAFEGNLWKREAKARLGLFVDERTRGSATATYVSPDAAPATARRASRPLTVARPS